MSRSATGNGDAGGPSGVGLAGHATPGSAHDAREVARCGAGDKAEALGGDGRGVAPSPRAIASGPAQHPNLATGPGGAGPGARALQIDERDLNMLVLLYLQGAGHSETAEVGPRILQHPTCCAVPRRAFLNAAPSARPRRSSSAKLSARNACRCAWACPGRFTSRTRLTWPAR